MRKVMRAMMSLQGLPSVLGGLWLLLKFRFKPDSKLKLELSARLRRMRLSLI
jgi:hypothetical protein